MFYDNFIELCDQNKVSPSYVVQQIGLNKSSATYWKNGSMPKDDTLRKLANFFHVTVRSLIDNSEELREEQRRAFIEKCKILDDTLDEADKVLTFNDVDYLKKIVDGRIKATTDCVESLAIDLGISVSYLLGLSDTPTAPKIKESSHFADEVDVILTTLHLKRLIEDDLHQQCSVEDAEAISSLIFDFIGPQNLVPLGWAVDSLLSHRHSHSDVNEENMWRSMFFEFMKYYYAQGGRINRLKSIAADKKISIHPAMFDQKGNKDYYCIVALEGNTVLTNGDVTIDEVERFIINYVPYERQKTPQTGDDPSEA